MIRDDNDNFFIGFLIGAVVPIAGFILIGQLFDLLSHYNLMDAVSFSSSHKRQRTTLLLAIACNILSVQYLSRKRKGTQTIKGVVAATFIYAAYWLYMYYDILIRNI